MQENRKTEKLHRDSTVFIVHTEMFCTNIGNHSIKNYVDNYHHGKVL
jgi:hypothetical protein